MSRARTDRTDWTEVLSGLPDGWRLLRLKHVVEITNSNVDKKSYEDGTPVRLCNYTDVYYQEFITDDLDLMRATASESEIERFSLLPGDVLITKDSESWDDIAVPAVVAEELSGVVCGYHLTILRPREDEIDGRFLHRALQSSGVREQFYVSAKGITRYGLSQHHIQDVLIPTPPLDEQRQLAAYLDRKTGEIDALIQKKQALIVLLREQRTALVHRAVTKGLDPDVPMKESGVEWLGEVPEHWDLSQLRRLVPDDRGIMYGIVLPGPHFEGGVPIVKASSCLPGRMKLAKMKRTDPAIEARYERSRLRSGDIVISIRGSYGSPALVPDELDGANLTQDAARISPRPGIDSKWLLYSLGSSHIQAYFDSRLAGATVKGINIWDLQRVPLPVPPSGEQSLIAEHLDQEVGGVDQIVRREKLLIDRLRELRTSLISEVVTGKIDVRATPPANGTGSVDYSVPPRPRCSLATPLGMRVIIDIEDDDHLRRVIRALGVKSVEVRIADLPPADAPDDLEDSPASHRRPRIRRADGGGGLSPPRSRFHRSPLAMPVHIEVEDAARFRHVTDMLHEEGVEARAGGDGGPVVSTFDPEKRYEELRALFSEFRGTLPAGLQVRPRRDPRPAWMRLRPFADTNVLVYSVDTDETKRRQAFRALAAQPVVVISAQIVAEFVNTCLRRKIMSPADARRIAHRYMDTYRLVPNDEAVLRRGLGYHERYGFQWWDALVVAAAVEAGCPTLYSEDMQDGQEIDGTRIVNPFPVSA